MRYPFAEDEGEQAVSQPPIKHKPRARRGVDHLIAQFGAGEIVEAVAGAVADDDVFGINHTELSNHPADVVIIEQRRDVKRTDDCKHLVNARGGHRGAHGIDHAAMTTGG